MSHGKELQALQSYDFVPDGPCIVQELLHEPPACADASHMRLNIHPLNLCDCWCKTFEAANPDVRVGVADYIEPAAWGVELRLVFEIGRDHRIDIKGQPVVYRSAAGDPAQILRDQTSRSVPRRGVLDGEKFDCGSAPGRDA